MPSSCKSGCFLPSFISKQIHADTPAKEVLYTNGVFPCHEVGSSKVHLHSYLMVMLTPTGTWNQHKKAGRHQTVPGRNSDLYMIKQNTIRQ